MLDLILCGPTAVGKSDFALQLAKQNGASIISADSRQLYREMPIGTAQANWSMRQQVPHFLIAELELSIVFSAPEFGRRAQNLISENPQTSFLMVGGTGLYVNEFLFPSANSQSAPSNEIRLSVHSMLSQLGKHEMHKRLQLLDPKVAQKIHPNDGYRITKAWEHHLANEGSSYAANVNVNNQKSVEVPVLVMTEERERLRLRIIQRVEAMLAQGWLNETELLVQKLSSAESPLQALNALGYGELIQVLQRDISLEEAKTKIVTRSVHYAKKQMTYFRSRFPFAAFIERAELYALAESHDWQIKKIVEALNFRPKMELRD